MKRLIFISTLLLLFACGNNNSANKQVNSQKKQLNISILLDLSDRINPQKYPVIPEHFQRDVEIVKAVTEHFKTNMENLTAWKAKGKIRAFFSPVPSNPAINEIASKLNIDCSKIDNKGRKEVYDTLTPLFSQNLTEIYEQSIIASSWEGSDVWRFFKDDVQDYCIEKDDNYRNILIILTDGYIYHKQSAYKRNNRYSYLLSSNIGKYRNGNWQEQIDNVDFGLTCTRNDLQDLEVLVLEVSAENQSNKIDEDILKYSLKKWFKEMNVCKYEVYSSDLPANTKTRIDRFLNN
ncbi:MAG: hypothetical protein LBI96_03880 [Odoribacteraceae bacterium]|jgi:hypothetical protein|nr:hypothetical protein [Odoribacteraceae bacterium]